MSFEQLVNETITQVQFDELKTQLGSPHRRTKLLNDPSNATFDQLLLFAELLDKPALYLYEQYHVGKNVLTIREYDFLMKSITYNYNHEGTNTYSPASYEAKAAGD